MRSIRKISQKQLFFNKSILVLSSTKKHEYPHKHIELRHMEKFIINQSDIYFYKEVFIFPKEP